MNKKHNVTCWVCLTMLMVAGLATIPPYLTEQRKLDQMDRILDMKERAFLKIEAPRPTVSMPAAKDFSVASRLL